MKFVVVCALALAVMLGAWISASARAEDYVKVEIKRRFMFHIGSVGYGLTSVNSGGEHYDLDLTRPAGKALTEKRLKEMDGEIVIVQGRLVLKRGAFPSVEVTKLTLVPPKADK